MPSRLKVPTSLIALCLVACGSDRPTSFHARSILGGGPATLEPLAAVGALVHRLTGRDEVFCTGALVDEDLVLTAAHCLARRADTPLLFFLGERIGQADAARQTHAIAEWQLHPRFDIDADPPTFLGDRYDIAVARLAAPVGGIAALPPLADDELPLLRRGQAVVIAGFGQTAVGQPDSAGRRYEGTTIIGEVGSTEIWIGGAPAAQKCVGDSGGPTLIDADPQAEGLQPRLVGVASRSGADCTGGSAETRVDAFADWIATQRARPCTACADAGADRDDASSPAGDQQLAPGDDGGCALPAGRPARGAWAVLLLLLCWAGWARYAWSMSRWLLAALIAALLFIPAPATLFVPASATAARARGQKPHKRCRDIFCRAEVIALDKKTAKGGLTVAQVEKVMKQVRPRLEPCMVDARRRDPNHRRALVEFVVADSGRVLATRVDGKRRTRLARCVDRHLRRARFPKNRKRHQVASFTLTVLN